MSAVTYGTGREVPIHHWATQIEVGKAVWGRLKELSVAPDIYQHLVVLPNATEGIGCPVGTVVATRRTLIPSLLGHDIGCGVRAATLGMKSTDLTSALVSELRTAIESSIPVGTLQFTEPIDRLGRWPKWGLFVNLKGADIRVLASAQRQVGTLGAGGHFIELCEDEGQNLWVVVQAGSRDIGKTLSTFHTAAARLLPHNEHIPPEFASFLSGSSEMQACRDAVQWTQDYAAWNRENIMEVVKDIVESFFPFQPKWRTVVDSPHNFVSWERHFNEHVFVLRRGAIRAGKGDLGVIPGGLGKPTYIVCGKGATGAFHSAAAGVGRRISREGAAKFYSLDDFRKATDGVDCRKDERMLGEHPMAFKSIDVVMRQQMDLVSVVAKLRPLLSVKG